MMKEDDPRHPLMLFPGEFTRLHDEEFEPEYEFSHPSWQDVHEKLVEHGWKFQNTEVVRDTDPYMIEWMGLATYAHPETETLLNFAISANATISPNGFDVLGSSFDVCGEATLEELT